MAGSRGKRHRISDDTKPAFHGLTLNVSIALATVGDEMRPSSARTAGSRDGSIGVMGPPLDLGGSPRTGSDRLLPALGEEGADLLQRRPDLVETGIDGEGALEVLGGPRRVILLKVDEPEPGERAEVDRVQPNHFLAVRERTIQHAHQVVHGRPLVPTFGEAGRTADDLAEDVHRLREPPRAHELDALLEEGIDRAVAGSRPDRPQRVARGLTDARVGVVEGVGEAVDGPGVADLAELGGRGPALGRRRGAERPGG